MVVIPSSERIGLLRSEEEATDAEHLFHFISLLPDRGDHRQFYTFGVVPSATGIPGSATDDGANWSLERPRRAGLLPPSFASDRPICIGSMLLPPFSDPKLQSAPAAQRARPATEGR